MWSEAVVRIHKVIQDHLSLGYTIEQVAIQTFGFQGADESLNERVLPGTAQRDVERLAALIRQPLLDAVGHELRAVVTLAVLMDVFTRVVRGWQWQLSRLRQLSRLLDHHLTLNLLSEKWQRGTIVDVIYLSGGGAELVYADIAEAYPQTHLVTDAQLANAPG